MPPQDKELFKLYLSANEQAIGSALYKSSKEKNEFYISWAEDSRMQKRDIRWWKDCAFAYMLMVCFGSPSMFITLWFGFDYGTNPPLGTLII
jgi:hypothetical protein